MSLFARINNSKYSEIGIFIILYLVMLGITGRYAIFEQVIIADQSREYFVYLEAINSSGWHYIDDNILNACIVVTYLPAQIQKATGCDAELIFKIFPCIFYSLLPPFVYLIARKYMGMVYAIFASILVLSNFFILYYPSIGRVGVALAFMAGMIWGLLNRKYITTGVLAVLLVLSHYGTAYISIGLLLVVVVYLSIRRRFDIEFRTATITLLILSISVFVWYHLIAISPSIYAMGFVDNTIESATGMTSSEYFSLSSREEVVQVAFGNTWGIMNIPQKIEFGLSWLIVILVTWGLVYIVKTKIFTETHRIMAIVAYLLILLGVAIPYISNYYGMGRIWFTSLIILSPAFVLGIKALADRYGFSSYIILLAILIPYGLCVSGVMHLMFEISK